MTPATRVTDLLDSLSADQLPEAAEAFADYLSAYRADDALADVIADLRHDVSGVAYNCDQLCDERKEIAA
ncbi:MAG: hypothetical protein AAGE05_04325 [Pseudomonadota bacterium]